MKQINSFKIDHDRLMPGLYVSRRDKNTYTLDIRLIKPNSGIIEPAAMHTIEHVAATYLRNSEYEDSIVYFGPMGCLTGCYLVLFDTLSENEAAAAVKKTFEFILGFHGEIPGASASRECGNWRLNDLDGAKKVAESFLLSFDGTISEYPQ